MRGTASLANAARSAWRFIPARAGNSGGIGRLRVNVTVHPRSCGEQYQALWRSLKDRGSSPLVRGTGPVCSAYRRQGRFIPARAGNRCQRLKIHNPLPVHPRSCGEQVPQAQSDDPHSGSSPLVRGTGLRRRLSAASRRFIPARAGNRIRPTLCR